MIERIIATEFIRDAKNGRTQPIVLLCDHPDGSTVEVFCKPSVGCDEEVVNLAREMVSACLAADLGLPIPKPYFVEIDEEFIESVPDEGSAGRLRLSSDLAFGSTIVPAQFTTWIEGTAIPDSLVPVAASLFIFDGIIQNPDRRVGNANCLVRGDEIRIIDHELAFAHKLIFGWTPPWAIGGFSAIAQPAHHIFTAKLKGRQIDFEPITLAWKGLSDARLSEYASTLPIEWAVAAAAVNDAVTLITDARDQIDQCIVEAQRVLT